MVWYNVEWLRLLTGTLELSTPMYDNLNPLVSVVVSGTTT